MNLLQRALIEKSGNDNGFEYVLAGAESAVNLASALHNARVRIVLSDVDGQFLLAFTSPTAHLLNNEITRSFPQLINNNDGFVAGNQDQLARLLRRAAALARALPNQAVDSYESTLKAELDQLPPQLKGTEVEKVVRQRVGQQAFRHAMLDYWGGACAVTGVAMSDVLRASHAKPWAECASDTERLYVFNGFLLTANLDALFDRFLISFNDDGGILVDPKIPQQACDRLGLNETLQLRWLADEHLPYLQFHRERFGANVNQDK